jgi:hypothetical protein
VRRWKPMTHRSVLGMGDALSDFSTRYSVELANFRNSLIMLYRVKARDVAKREAVRFQYLSEAKAKISNLISKINSSLFSSQNANLYELTTKVTGAIQSHIPMVSLNGAALDGWGTNPHRFGGRLQLGLLSPIQDFIQNPFNGPNDPDQSPAYIMFQTEFFGPNHSVDKFVSQYFLNFPEVNVPFSIPPSLDWCKLYAGHEMTENEIEFTYPLMIQFFNQNGIGTELSSACDQARALFYEVVERTLGLMTVQLEIDKLEKDLSQFVEEYRGQFDITAQQLLADIQNESTRAEVIAPVAQSLQVSESASEPVMVPVIEKASSNLPMIAAAAAIFYFLRRK